MLKFLMRKLPACKQFEFEPRYYDAAKEAMQKRKRRIVAELKAQREGIDSSRACAATESIIFRRRKSEIKRILGTRLTVILLCLLILWYLL